ncbi:hypothetical protein NQ314_009056 [Rhamnusium bicolor]|uniref:C2H2-type domain-containing protein n=1 Tax=Rhamnusium bicolor TaxID=1586634 RepID=A0AAV8Y578_9CUCU|nr:hypothetical protein NQ314_009056 [Rhamnusium bicolor]
MEDIKNKYVKSSSARERPTLCPICYQDVVTHFPRHLFRHHQDHKDVKLIKKSKTWKLRTPGLDFCSSKTRLFSFNH